MNATERADWIKRMKEQNRYAEMTTTLKKGQNEHDVCNEMRKQIYAEYSPMWVKSWNHYPKFGNPIVIVAFVTEEAMGV